MELLPGDQVVEQIEKFRRARGLIHAYSPDTIPIDEIDFVLLAIGAAHR